MPMGGVVVVSRGVHSDDEVRSSNDRLGGVLRINDRLVGEIGEGGTTAV